MTRVGTGGPCAHCGRVSSPCWRKGPPEKPLLCNACGARFLVKHSLEGYVPNAKPLAKREGVPVPKPKKEAGLRALAAAGRPAGEKRKRTLSKRFADDQDDDLPFHGSFVSEPDFRRTVVVRHHRDGRCTVDRGTQTYGGLTADAKLFAAGQPLQEEDFKGLAATLALLRQSPAEESSETTSGTMSPTPPRRRRKPPRPTARTLF